MTAISKPSREIGGGNGWACEVAIEMAQLAKWPDGCWVYQLRQGCGSSYNSTNENVLPGTRPHIHCDKVSMATCAEARLERHLYRRRC